MRHDLTPNQSDGIMNLSTGFHVRGTYRQSIGFLLMLLMLTSCGNPRFTESINGLPLETPDIIEDWLILMTHHGYIHRMKAADFDNQRKTRVGKGVTTSPTYFGSSYFIPLANGKNGLVAYDFIRGKETWKLSGHLSESSPVLIENLVVHATRNGFVLGIDRKTGKELWKNSTGHAIYSSLAMSGERVVAVSQNGNVRCLQAESGSVFWQNDLKKAVFTDPLILGNFVYVADFTGSIYRIGLMDGVIYHTRNLSVPVYTNLSASNDAVFVSGSDGKIWRLDPDSLELGWSAQLDGALTTPPAEHAASRLFLMIN